MTQPPWLRALMPEDQWQAQAEAHRARLRPVLRPWLDGRRFAFTSERCSLSFLRRSFTAFEIRVVLRGTGGFLASKMALRNLLRASCLFFS